MRLQKFLAHCGICSRRKAETHILEGDVQVNGQIVNTLGSKVDPTSDVVLFRGRRVTYKDADRKIYIALNKPVGVISSCSHGKERIVLDLIDIEERIYPVGRLDKDSQGLILLTNDGELHNKLSHPSFSHEKEYIVTTKIPIQDEDLKRMAHGMMIDQKKTRKAVTSRLTGSSFKIILKQGMNRQIRKMVVQCNNKVKTLKRIRIANIRLGNLKTGKWRFLRPDEVRRLTQ